MAGSILKKIRQQVTLMLIVVLVLVAAYVSAGRQFMPAVSRYVSYFEEQIFELIGIPVQVQSLVGDFEGFNPVFHVNGMSLSVADTHSDFSDAISAALYLHRASVVIDIPQSIWRRSWVLEDFVVEALALNLDQSESGEWQLRGLSGSNGAAVDFTNLYRALQRVSQLSLRNVVINLRTFDGEVLSFRNGLATIQNRGDKHFLHANLTLEGYSQQIALSFEMIGNDFSDIEGSLHLDVPEADYSALFQRQTLAEMSVQQLIGGGEFWFSFVHGKLDSFVAEPSLSNISFISANSSPLSLSNISGKTSLRQVEEDNSWQLALSDMSLSWQQLDWPFSAYMELHPAQSLSLRADNIDLSLIAQLVESSGLSSTTVQQQLEGYAPRGTLKNFSLYLPLAEDSEEHLLLKTNLASVDVDSVGGSPKMWGVNGYAEIDYDPIGRFATGLAELESDEFRLNIPTVFTSIWDHNYINGSLGFSLDLNQGMTLKLVSNVIVADTAAGDGRVQFTSIINRPENAAPNVELELVVGVLHFDAAAAARSGYIPDGPRVNAGLANTMRWLDGAILDAAVANSGVLYRGSTLPTAPAASKTFQSFYLINEGELNFSDEWPDLSNVTAHIITDDKNIDIEIQEADSLDLRAGSVTALIRENDKGENWLSIQGQASGATSAALNYLQNAAVGDNLKSALANWQTIGEFSSNIAVDVPLNSPQLQTEVRLDMSLQDNSLLIPDYALQIQELSGSVLFDTRTGIEDTELSGRLFQQLANIKLSSALAQGELSAILVQATGLVAPEQLIAWPLQSQFVGDMLGRMEGQFDYQANLNIDLSDAAEPVNRLAIESTLLGASLSLPQPFTKSVEVELPLAISLEFGGDREQVVGTLGSTLSFDLALQQGEITDGLIVVGDSPSNFENLRDSESEGLVVLGSMDRFEVQQWSDFLAGFTSNGSVAEGLGSSIGFVDIQIGAFEFYGEQLSAVDLRIVPQLSEQHWQIDLHGEAIAGQVKLPFDSDDYLNLDFRYLRLPGDETGRMGPQQEPNSAQRLAREQSRVDVLKDIDPRQLPRMHFSTNEFRLGDRPYGNWSFTLSPNSKGAEIEDLAFDFRGLRLELDTALAAADEDDATTQLIPHFNWFYDGVQHKSTLSGVLTTNNLADVLTANGYAASLESSTAEFIADVSWPGSPAFFEAASLSGELSFEIENGRFLQGSGAAGALKLISILNFDAIMRRLRFSDDLLRSGLAYDEITGQLTLEDGQVKIEDRLVISGPSSLYQITGDINLKDETIAGEMYLTLPLSQNIPWLGLLTANLPLAVGAYLLDRIFGSQVNSLTSAVYRLEGPWEGLQPEFKQAFGSPDSAPESAAAVQ